MSNLTADERFAHLNKRQRTKLMELMLGRFTGITVFAKAVVAGKARWEPFSGSKDHGEVCVNGLRYSTYLEDGIPMVEGPLLDALNKVTEHLHRG